MADDAALQSAFPRLTDDEMDLVRSMARREEFRDGQVVFRAGDADIDFFVVESGAIDILNPANQDKRITLHEPREFAGDIDMLTRRAVIVTAVARGDDAVLLRVPGKDMRRLLNAMPRLGDKLLVAFRTRRELLQHAGVLGMTVIGAAHSSQTTLVREFLYKNFVPHMWIDSEHEDGRRELAELNRTADQTPVIKCGDGAVLTRPSLRELAKCAGLQMGRAGQVYDFAVIGSGPAGMAAAVYAASEALSTVVIDRLGPGGQASGSSLIENFIGFPSGLSGLDLATRGVLQMLKFGALLLTPVTATELVPGDAQSASADGAIHTIKTDDGGEVKARCVLIATGVKWRRLEAKNAQRFERAGIYYAATSVEARVCADQPVVVIGGGNSAGQAAMFLSECSPKVHMLIRGDSLAKGMSEYLHNRIRQNHKIELHTNTEVTEVFGEREIESIDVIDKRTGKTSRVPCNALFVFIGAEPNVNWLPPQIATDEHGYIRTGVDAILSGRWPILGREPCPLETTLPGVLAGGDVRAGSTKRVGFAVGDGSLAVTCVHRLRAMQA